MPAKRSSHRPRAGKVEVRLGDAEARARLGYLVSDSGYQRVTCGPIDGQVSWATGRPHV
jgi:hypothetical protein